MPEKKHPTAERLNWVWKPLITGLIFGLLVMAAVTYWSTGENTWQELRAFNILYALAAFGVVFIA